MAIIIKRKSARVNSTKIEPVEELVPEQQKPTTLAQVIDRVLAENILSAARKRDLISACNSVARLSGNITTDVPADPAELRAVLRSINHVQAGISKKRLANIRSDFAAALLAVGIIPDDDKQEDPSRAWRTFLGSATKKHHV